MADSGGVLVGGAWREGDKMGFKTHDGVWHEIDKGYYKTFDGVWRECYSSGPILSELPIGAILNIQERDYGLQRYIVLQHNYENSNRTLILRERAVVEAPWRVGGLIPDYGLSSMAQRLNRGGDIYNSMYQGMTIDGLIQSITIKCTHHVSDSVANQIISYQASVFLLSAQELFRQSDSSYFIFPDGTYMPYFDDHSKRTCVDNAGQQVQIWTRTLLNYDYQYVLIVGTDYTLLRQNGSNDYVYVRPATTLCADALFTQQPDGTYALNT